MEKVSSMHMGTLWSDSLELRRLFRQIERKPWGAIQYAMELFVQLGHFADILLRQEFKVNRFSQTENQRILGDEIADIILNLFSMADATGLTYQDLNLEGLQSTPNESDTWDVLFFQLTDHCQYLSVCIAQRQSTQEHCSSFNSAIRICLIFVHMFHIDIGTSFKKMYDESLAHIQKHIIAS